MSEKKDKKIKNQPEEVKSKEVEYLELAQRIKAEFENYKKRNAEITTQSFDNGVAHTVEKLLPAMDSFKQAKASIQDENTLKGLDLVYTQILKAFEEMGIYRIKALGEQFDPNFHNAVLVGNDTEKADMIFPHVVADTEKDSARVERFLFFCCF